MSDFACRRIFPGQPSVLVALFHPWETETRAAEKRKNRKSRLRRLLRRPGFFTKPRRQLSSGKPRKTSSYQRRAVCLILTARPVILLNVVLHALVFAPGYYLVPLLAPLVIATAMLTHRFVEAPSIALGKRMAKRLQQSEFRLPWTTSAPTLASESASVRSQRLS